MTLQVLQQLGVENEPNPMSDLEPKSSEETALRLAAIFESAIFAIITINRDGIVEDFNPSAQEMFGYSSEEVVGRNVKMLMPEPFQSAHDDYIDGYISTGEKKVIGIGRQAIGRRADATTFPIILSVSEVRLADRWLFTGMVEDIEARVKAENQVRKLQDELAHVARVSAMGEMASALAHELGQPLTAISNYASAARRVLDQGEETASQSATSLILKAGEQAVRAGKIIRSLRKFVETGESDRSYQDMKQAVDEAAGLAFVGARAKGISYKLNAPQKLPQVMVDRIQIQQVFQNIVRNAVDAMIDRDGDKVIAIDLLLNSDGQMEVVVEDTGPGLSPQVKRKLFEPFVTTKANGMGIGLSVSRNIIEAHGGKIVAENRPGGGARFCVTLPLNSK